MRKYSVYYIRKYSMYVIYVIKYSIYLSSKTHEAGLNYNTSLSLGVLPRIRKGNVS
jgi:hypothetical protein